VSLSTAIPLDPEWLSGIPGLENLVCEQLTTTFRSPTPSRTLAAVLRVLEDRDVELLELHARKARLEDVFLALTGDHAPN
jgi:hypothetical protein